MPTAGRLRAGRKGDRGQPEKLQQWRATSHDEQAIRQIAERYGGTPYPWDDPKVADGQWEVVTAATEIPIVLPPEPLGNTPVYEMWSGGGCQRRCDGIVCETTTQGPDGAEPAEVSCVCEREGALACQPTTRLSVILPEVRFAGVWRIDTRSWHAARELPGMVDMVQLLQQQAGGLSRGVVALEERRTVQGGQTRRFMVPVIRNTHSPDEIASGDAALGSLHSGEPDPAGAIESGDDDVADGEVVDVGGDSLSEATERGGDPMDAAAWEGLAGSRAKLAKNGHQASVDGGFEAVSSADDAIDLASRDAAFAEALRQRLGGDGP